MFAERLDLLKLHLLLEVEEVVSLLSTLRFCRASVILHGLLHVDVVNHRKHL